MNFGIVSSVDESCGNASFTQIIIDSLNETGHSTTGVPLNLKLTQSSDPQLVKVANEHIHQVSKALKEFDAVNIQYEPGLYGPSAGLIYKRLKVLLTSSNRCVVTIHSTRLFTSNNEKLLRQTLKYLARFQLRRAIGYFTIVKNQQRVAKDNRRVISLFVRHSAKLIVHTRHSQDLIKEFWKYEDVHVHPLKFVKPGEHSGNRSKWFSKYDLDESDILIGIFGYVSKYKGHETALEALKQLPSNYKLVIAGRQHPQSIREHTEVDSFIEGLLTKIADYSKIEKNFSTRIIFVNELEHREFCDLAASVDYAWLPYLEVGQDGSGIASILLELSQSVVASNAKSFDELFALEPGYKCERFDIGNYLELASKTRRYEERRNLNNLLYSVDSQRKLYLELLSTK